MNSLWIIVSSQGEIAALKGLLAFDQSEATALVIGPNSLAEEAAQCAQSVKWIDTKGMPEENFANAATNTIVEANPCAVVGVSTSIVRSIAGKLSVEWDAPIVSNTRSVSIEESTIKAEHTIIDGNIIESVEATDHACLLVNPFDIMLEEPAESSTPGSIEELQVSPDDVAEIIATEPVAESSLSSAELIVSVGRGIGNEEAFAKATELASILGAEVGCSMPVVNDLGLLPTEAYVGWSGARVSPKLYLAFGIKGVTQHVVGCRSAQTIVCVNNDPKAPFFKNSDYGIVADLNEAIPEFIKALSE